MDNNVLKHLQDVEAAIKRCDYSAASQHLDAAAAAGGDAHHIAEYDRKLKRSRIEHNRNVQGSVRLGFFIALVGYLILSIRQPLGWTMKIWIPMAFLAVPAVAGIFVGWRHAGERSPVNSFKDGARSALFAMACYAGFNVLILAHNLQKDATQAGEEYMAGFLTVVVFSLVAGLIAGVVSAAVSRLGSGRVTQ